MTRGARAVRLGEEKLSPEELKEAQEQEAARSILSRRGHRVAALVDQLRELAETSATAAERKAFARALAGARAGRDIVLAAFNAVRVS